MKVSLAKANKFRNILEDKFLPKLEAEIANLQTVTFNGVEDESEIRAAVEGNLTAIEAKIEFYGQAVTAIEVIRGLIAEANQRHGVNAVIAGLNSKKKLLGFYKNLQARQSAKPLAFSHLLRLIEDGKKAEANASIYARRQTQSYIPWDADFNYDATSLTIEGIEKDFRALEEKRNEINFSKTVSLDDETLKVLVAFGLA